MQSIIPGDLRNCCHYCGFFFENTHKHHIFGGANRKWSEKYGLFVHLCPEHHNMSDESVHHNARIMEMYHELGQMCFEADYVAKGHSVEEARQEFMKIFGRNWL